MASMSRWALFALLLLISGSPSPARADNLQLVEQQIKAGLIYNFLKYTTWPNQSGPIVVCLYEHDPFYGSLEPMSKRTVSQRAISVRTVRAPSDIAACSLLYSDARQKRNWPPIQASLAGAPVLTVGEFDGFAAGGGMIEFTRTMQRVGIKINTDAISRAHLAIDDSLLRLGSKIPTDNGE